jgi:hypothetical protein
MVQLVFVHGVATRSGDGYAQAVQNRDALFKDILFEGQPVKIRSPQWGDLVPPIDPRVFETANGITSFSLAVQPQGMGGGLAGGAGPAGDLSLASIAEQNSIVVLDAIFAELVETADRTGIALSASDIAAFRQATRAMADNKTDALLDGAATDDEIAFNLGKSQTGSFGIGSKIKDAIDAVANHLRNAVSTVGFGAVRDSVSPAVAFFLGDVFNYLKEGDLRSAIQAKVRADVLAAHEAAKASGAPLVLVGHSLGGVIVTDMLESPRESGLPDDLKVSALITVGSQSGLFQSAGVLSLKAPAGQLIPRPRSVANWFNVFDPIDPLAFRADPIYTDVDDFSFNSITGLASAHTTYFKRPQFHARCRKRLQDLGLI